MAHTMQSMGQSISKQAKKFGKQFESHPAKVVPESRVEKVSRLARVAMDKAERAVHEAKSAKTFRAAKKKMAVAQKHLSAAYKACEKAK